jgi:cytochrome c-type biogenesis protein CcmH/NrfF
MSMLSRLPRLLTGILAVLLVAAMTMGFADNGTRYSDLSHKMMCACGCGQILGECNHVGCPSSGPMLDELRTDLAQGATDNAILIAFQNKYGPTILAAPMFTNFNMIAWIMPPLVLLIGIAGTVVLVRRWRMRAAALPPVQRSVQFQGARDRVRRETDDLGEGSIDRSPSNVPRSRGDLNHGAEVDGEAGVTHVQRGKGGREQ